MVVVNGPDRHCGRRRQCLSEGEGRSSEESTWGSLVCAKRNLLLRDRTKSSAAATEVCIYIASLLCPLLSIKIYSYVLQRVDTCSFTQVRSL